VFDGRSPPLGIDIESVRAVVKPALPALDGLAIRLLAHMALVALDGSASPAFGAGVLERKVPEDLDNRVGHIPVVIWAAHITTLSRQVIAVADLGFFGPEMISVHSIRRRMRTVCVEAIPVFIEGDIVLGLGLGWQGGREELQGATDNGWSTPQLLRRFFRRLGQLLIRHDVLLDATVAIFANSLIAGKIL
jgi:hypothetical protein